MYLFGDSLESKSFIQGCCRRLDPSGMPSVMGAIGIESYRYGELRKMPRGCKSQVDGFAA